MTGRSASPPVADESIAVISASVLCGFCDGPCIDFRQELGGKRMCVCCLSSRLDEEHATLNGITAVCVSAGFDPDGDLDEASWLRVMLGRDALGARAGHACVKCPESSVCCVCAGHDHAGLPVPEVSTAKE